MDKAAKKDPVVTGSEEVNAGHLRAFIERIERLEEEKKALSDDIKDVYGEAKGNGFDVKIMRKIVSIRKQDRDKRREEEEILDLYLSALGIDLKSSNTGNAMSESLSAAAERVAEAFAAAVASRRTFDAPYRHCLMENCFPTDVAEELAHLPFAAPVLNGVSGKRELHNDQRSYFDAGGVTRFPVMRGVAEALQSRGSRA